MVDAPLQPQQQTGLPQVEANNPDQMFLSKVKKLRALAPSLGLSTEDIEGFLGQQQASFLAQKGINAKDIQTDPIRLSAQVEQIANGKNLPGQDNTSAEAYVYQLKESLDPSLSIIPDPETRDAAAEMLKKEGINLATLGKQNEGKVVAENIKTVRDLFQSKKLAKGRYGGAIANFLASQGGDVDVKNYNDYRASAVLGLKDLLTNSKGGRVSPDVLSRLEGLLPKVTDTEEEVKGNWENLQKLIKNKYDIDIGTYEEGQTAQTEGNTVGRFVVEEL